MTKRCIMGGRFDPVHIAHIQTALDVCAAKNIDVLHLIPTYNPPHRDGAIASFEQRCEMLNLAIKSLKTNSLSFEVDKRESESEDKSYTFMTIQSLKKQYPNDELFLMMGSDAFLVFDTWYNWQHLLMLCNVVIDQRPGDSVKQINEKKAYLEQHVPESKISFCEVMQMAISSSQIRQNLKQGVNATGMLTPDVFNYINNQKLYR